MMKVQMAARLGFGFSKVLDLLELLGFEDLGFC